MDGRRGVRGIWGAIIMGIGGVEEMGDGRGESGWYLVGYI